MSRPSLFQRDWFATPPSAQRCFVALGLAFMGAAGMVLAAVLILAGVR